MKLLISYATTQGQTRLIAQRVADTLYAAGHSVEMLPLKDADAVGLERFDGGVFAASIHAGHYQKPLARFAETHLPALKGMPTLFLSVSLAAAGHDAEDWRTLDQIAADFSEATGWTPGKTIQVAGAYKPSEYDIVTGFIMRRIIIGKDPEADPKLDKDYTDWEALAKDVTDWATSIAA
jgi:menaquinone-dependent protoporphyrinogen oxidase